MTSIENKGPKESGGSSPADVCQCDHSRGTHAANYAMCHMYGLNYRECPVHGERVERRERYADAVHDADSAGRLDYREALFVADAVMAVADEETRVSRMETAQLVAGQYAKENVRLHKELKESEEHVADLEKEILDCPVLKHQATVERVTALLDARKVRQGFEIPLSREIREALNKKED